MDGSFKHILILLAGLALLGIAGSVHTGGIVRKTDHPSGKTYMGGPQMVEISRDGKRVYWTNGLYSTWDDQFYPAGVPGAMVKADVGAGGGLTLDKDFWVEFPHGYRTHQIRLEGDPFLLEIGHFLHRVVPRDPTVDHPHRPVQIRPQ